MTPLFPVCRPACRPGDLESLARYTRTSWSTQGGSSWESSRENTRTSTTLPDSPWGHFNEVSGPPGFSEG